MNLFRKLQQRAESGDPVRVGLIGAGKFGSMFLSQAPRTPGIHVLGVVDLSIQRGGMSREAKWTECLAVGSEPFV